MSSIAGLSDKTWFAGSVFWQRPQDQNPGSKLLIPPKLISYCWPGIQAGIRPVLGAQWGLIDVRVDLNGDE
jgi:hypothetical protein